VKLKNKTTEWYISGLTPELLLIKMGETDPDGDSNCGGKHMPGAPPPEPLDKIKASNTRSHATVSKAEKKAETFRSPSSSTSWNLPLRGAVKRTEKHIRKLVNEERPERES